MQVKLNMLLKMVVFVCLFIVIVIGVKFCGLCLQFVVMQIGDSVVVDLMQEELKVLGVEGDMFQDMLCMLVGWMWMIQNKQVELD